ncbi:ABC transporter permease [Phenylobacterium sp.]|uniref:ABC transporter permease n=1 Tax=Phenylobacterium sp. TaxID=1871053 RepID=UPI0035B2E104
MIVQAFGHWLRRGFMSLLALFIASPLVVVAAVSFNDSRRMAFPPTEISLRWYKAFFADAGWMRSLETSATISGFVALTTVILALPVAYAIWRYNAAAAKAIAALGSGMVLIPGVVSALMLSAFWGVTGHVGRIENVVLSHSVVMLWIPLTLLTIGFQAIDRSHVEAAQTMGASDSDTFRTVVRPAITPYVLCALIFVFVLSINEYLIAYMVAGFSVQTLPIRIFTSMRAGYEPTMCVGAVLFMILGFTAFNLIARMADLPKLMGRQRPLES